MYEFWQSVFTANSGQTALEKLKYQFMMKEAGV
jgi:hypothetical protein